MVWMNLVRTYLYLKMMTNNSFQLNKRKWKLHHHARKINFMLQYHKHIISAGLTRGERHIHRRYSSSIEMLYQICHWAPRSAVSQTLQGAALVSGQCFPQHPSVPAQHSSSSVQHSLELGKTNRTSTGWNNFWTEINLKFLWTVPAHTPFSWHSNKVKKLVRH